MYTKTDSALDFLQPIGYKFELGPESTALPALHNDSGIKNGTMEQWNQLAASAASQSSPARLVTSFFGQPACKGAHVAFPTQSMC